MLKSSVAASSVPTTTITTTPTTRTTTTAAAEATAIVCGLLLQRRTGLFSATQTKEVKELARAGMRNPVVVSVKVQYEVKSAAAGSGSGGAPAGTDVPADGDGGPGAVSSGGAVDAATAKHVVKTPATLRNWYVLVPYDRKPAELVAFLQQHQAEKVIVFFLTCAAVEFYSRALPVPNVCKPSCLLCGLGDAAARVVAGGCMLLRAHAQQQSV